MQVLDHTLPPLEAMLMKVEVLTDTGYELREFKVRAVLGPQEQMERDGVEWVRKLGFQVRTHKEA